MGTDRAQVTIPRIRGHRSHFLPFWLIGTPELFWQLCFLVVLLACSDPLGFLAPRGDRSVQIENGASPSVLAGNPFDGFWKLR